MQNSIYENLRNGYKPVNVEVLFVGESRPQGGTFFYQKNSALYRETKKAFNSYFAKDVFTLDNFKQWGCWLYDICESPVNNLNNHDRRLLIHENVSRLEGIVNQESPKIIIVCKKTLVEQEIRESNIMNIYHPEDRIFFLPFPGNGNQRRYREGLINLLNTINFDEKMAKKGP